MSLEILNAIHTAGLWTGLCVILLLVLSALTSANRRKHSVSIGDGGKHEVAVASRAFGNAIEYMPIALIALALMALAGFPVWAIHLVGVLWTVASKEHFRGSLMQLTLGVVILAYAVIRNHLKKRSQPKLKPLEQLQDWRGRDDL